MKVYQVSTILIAAALLSASLYSSMDYNKEKIRHCTVVGKMLVDGGRSVAYPTLGLKMEDGTMFDINVSVAKYSQFNIGDNITLPKADRELNHSFFKEVVSFGSFMLSGLTGCFGLMILLVGFFGGGLNRKFSDFWNS